MFRLSSQGGRHRGDTKRVIVGMIWLRGQDLPVRVLNQSTGLIYRRSRTSLTVQVMVSLRTTR